ncbi:MAG: T9SS type A sorting domain-containing protein [Candidatus Eisenbacteria bacterium]
MRNARLLPFLLLLVLPAASRGQAVWVIDTLDASVRVSSLALAIDSTGALHASYRHNATGDLNYGMHESGTWSIQFVSDSADNGSANSIAVSSAGAPAISYSSNKRLCFASRGGGGWTVELADPIHVSSWVFWSSLGLDEDERAHIVAWDMGMSIYYSHNRDSVWSVERLNPDDAYGAGAIVIGSDGKPRAAYPEYCCWALQTKLYFAVEMDGAWQRETADSSYWYHDQTHLALDSSDWPHMAYRRTKTYTDTAVLGVEYLSRTDEGAWSARGLDAVHSDPMYDSNYLTVEDLALDRFGRPHIVYRKHIHEWGYGEDPADTLFHVYKQGDTWIKEVVLDSPSGQACLVVDEDGVVIVLFTGVPPISGLYLARRYDATGLKSAPRPAAGLRLSVAPNPARGGGTISFTMGDASAPASSRARFSVYDIRGRVIRSLEAEAPSGALVWDGADASGRPLAPGVYFVRLNAGDTSATTRVTIVR